MVANYDFHSFASYVSFKPIWMRILVDQINKLVTEDPELNIPVIERKLIAIKHFYLDIENKIEMIKKLKTK